MKAHLKKLVAKGKTEKVIEQLVSLAIKDKGLSNEILALAGRHAKLRQDQLDAIRNQDQLDVEFNRINHKVLDIIERLPPTARLKSGISQGYFVAGTIGVIALIAITIFFLLPDQKATPYQIPEQETTQEEFSTPPATTTYTNFDSTNTKTHLEVKDQAKVGTIVTGDSNKIEIKQDF